MATSDDRSNSGTGFDSNFDSRLMGKDGDANSASKAGSLNEAKRNSNSPEAESVAEPQTLREAVIAEKRKQAAEETKAGGLKQKAAAPMRQGTSKLLQNAWINLIPSWGLTLIWINIHVFLSLVIGKDIFCKLGDEWLDGKFGGANPAKDAVLGEAGSKLTEKVSGCANLGESMMLVALDLLLLIVIIAIAAVIVLLVKFVEDPIGFYASEFKLIWGVVKGAIVN